LGEQRQRRHGLAGQATADVVEQGKRGLFDLTHRVFGEGLRAVHELLHHGLAGAQQGGTGRQASEFQRAHTLVDLLARRAQDGRVQRVHVGEAGRAGLLQAAVQGLVGRVQGLAEFLVHPGQGAEVIRWQRSVVVQAVHESS